MAGLLVEWMCLFVLYSAGGRVGELVGVWVGCTINVFTGWLFDSLLGWSL